MLVWILIALLASLNPAAQGATVRAEQSGSLVVGGVTRRFVYEVSSQPAPAGGRPLVIHLHGDGGNMGLSAAWKAAVLNDSNGAVLLSAQGRNNIPAAAVIDGSAWRFRMDEAGRPYDDTDFINAIITQATASAALLGAAINPQQVYLVGESRGAGFAYFLYADPRTRNKIRAIMPLSGTFYCDGGAQNEGTPGTQPTPGSDTTCGEVSPFGYWQPRASLFSAPGVTRTPHILDVHGQLPPAGSEGEDTAPPALNVDYGSSSWVGWGDAAGCYTVQVSSKTEQTLPRPIGGKAVKSYAFSQAQGQLATRCAGLDLTFYVVQGGGHVPGGFEATAWCFLSTAGGAPSGSACGKAPPPPAGDVTLSVNAAAARKPISPDIYGMHEAPEAFAREVGLPVRRNGGNLATRYNWQNTTTNSGFDDYFANRPADVDADDFVAEDQRTGTRSIITIPMTGWVAKDGLATSCGFDKSKYPAYQPDAASTNPNAPQCGNGVVGQSAQGTTLFFQPVDPRDTSVPFAPADARAWVEHFVTTTGSAAQGGVRYYSLDNEPDLWSETHADLVPTAKKYQEFRAISQQYAQAVKQADPTARILGPALGSYAYFFSSFYDGQLDHWTDETATDRMANGGTPFLAWYLQQMRAAEQQRGPRLLDYLDVHWYPQGGVFGSAAGDAALQARRLDSVRALWDASYTDTYWQQNGAPDDGVIRLIPRLKELVAANYPGTKIAISEYSWSAHADLNGALAQADVLGVFGREGVDLATLYNDRYEDEAAKFAPDRPSAYAFRMYRNYDGQGGRFGDTSVQATSSDQGKLAIYAAQRADGALTLMVINKTKGALSASLGLAGFQPAGGSAAVYRYSAANLQAIARAADQPLTASGLSASFPAESITLLVVPGTGAAQNQVFLPLTRR
jgi:predicted esterase